MSCNATDVFRSACTNGFAGLSSLRDYDVVLAELLCELKDAVSSISAGGNAPVMYSHLSDPITLGLTPTDQTKTCMAYSDDGSGATYGWNPNTLTWV